jgi:molybdenum cofactor biosynthesis enzyme MoaA
MLRKIDRIMIRVENTEAAAFRRTRPKSQVATFCRKFFLAVEAVRAERFCPGEIKLNCVLMRDRNEDQLVSLLVRLLIRDADREN